MAEENPSSEAPKPEKDDTDRERSPRVLDPSPKSESSSPPPDRAPSTHPSPPPPPATGAATEILAAAPNPSTQPAAAPAADGRSFSQLLAGAMASPVGSPRAAAPILAVPVDAVRLSGVAVPCFLAPLALLEPPGFTGQFAMTHQAVLASVTAQARIQMQAAHPSPEILTSSFPQPVLTAISPVPLQQRQPHVPEDNVCTPEAEQSDSSVQKPHPAQVVANTNSGGDGYNWRKYGQKQVKSGENYRSYYKCTDGSCSAKKKVERFPDGRVTEVMYRGQHNHDPPQQTRCLRVKGARFGVPVGENASLDLQSCEINESDPSISTTDKNSGNEMPEQQLFCSSDCEGDAGIKIEEDLRDEPDPKRRQVVNICWFPKVCTVCYKQVIVDIFHSLRDRLSECTITCSTPPLKTFREMKIVVHTACDMGPSTDGYKWRKYGQKIVKGNPNPRYKPIWEIVDRRWDAQLHQPLHAAGLYLNPEFFYLNPTMGGNGEVMQVLLDVIDRLVPDLESQDTIHSELSKYRNAEGLFGRPTAIRQRATIPPIEWWKTYGSMTPNLQKLVCRVLGLTCSARGCERNWNAFKHIHTKKRNKLEQSKLNDLVYVRYNEKLVERFKNRNSLDPITLLDIDDCNEWLTGSMHEELVHGEGDLTWGHVAQASGADDLPSRYTTRSQRQRGESSRRVVKEEPLFDSEESESDTDEEQYNKEADKDDSDGNGSDDDLDAIP